MRQKLIEPSKIIFSPKNYEKRDVLEQRRVLIPPGVNPAGERTRNRVTKKVKYHLRGNSYLQGGVRH